MASVTTCDVCNKQPAVGKVRVAVDFEGAVHEGKSTGRLEEMDSCAECQKAAAGQLYAKAVGILSAHIPVQLELLQLKEEIQALRIQREEHANYIGTVEQAVKTTLPADASTELRLAHSRVSDAHARHTGKLAEIDAQLAPKLARRNALIESTR